MKQTDVILRAMIENPMQKTWTAKDFQRGKYFVGYEASARMSDLMVEYPDLFIVGREGRFRTLQLNRKQKQLIKEIKERIHEHLRKNDDSKR